MLYPQTNAFRQVSDLSGFWDIRFDPEKEGDNGGWQAGFSGGRPIAVPASWNDQFEDWRDYLGVAWYQTSFDLPWGWHDHRIMLRFASVNYMADVWLNGTKLGSHEGGHLPFEFDASAIVRPSGNRLIVRVEGELAYDRVPPGNLPSGGMFAFMRNNPAANFDFFPFCGIQRPVVLCAVPRLGIEDVTVATTIRGADGHIAVNVASCAGGLPGCTITVSGHGANASTSGDLAGGAGTLSLVVPDAALWSPQSPSLYDLTVELRSGSTVVDRYSLQIGIRTIEVSGDSLLLNGRPILLKGFGRHEDFPVTGRGFMAPVIIKDYALLSWIGANSFRTTHYPYSEEMMQLADRLGFLVIDETPAVGLYFDESGLDRRLELCRQYTRDLIARDKNHASVIMWSLANEPSSNSPNAKAFFRNLHDLAKSLDRTRPTTVVNMMGVREEAFEFVDVVSLNRYYGWYVNGGSIEQAMANLSGEIDAIHAEYPKPVIMTEFGADCLAGSHAQPPEMFTEEYQADVIMRSLEVFSGKEYVAGYHVWNLCDFKTGQGVIRVGGMNLKGVFTRDRKPKLAAHRIRAAWTA